MRCTAVDTCDAAASRVAHANSLRLNLPRNAVVLPAMICNTPGAINDSACKSAPYGGMP
jgi:hypothetical protein